MKKLILAAFVLSTAAGVYAQGTVNLANRIIGVATTHIWGPSTTTPSLSLIGLGSNDSPAGSVNFSGSGMSMIGGALAGKYGASTTFAQLLGANGGGAAETRLVPVGQTTTFRTGGAIGNLVAITSTLSGATPPIPIDAAMATLEIVAWDNSSGLYPTWTQASAAWLAGTIAAGKSGAFNVSALSGVGSVTPTPYLNNVTPLNSFNLYFQVVPEPSSLALAGLGAAALLIFRRRK
ncbi:MAG: PEP-CTERM sorting domain-containing protein [Verrucomicrobiota bacterium]